MWGARLKAQGTRQRELILNGEAKGNKFSRHKTH